jgi:hypothetical protein
MAMTPLEEKKMMELEESLNELFRLLRGTGSRNMLNRLQVVLMREIEKLETKADQVQTRVDEILEYVRKAQ